MEPLSIWPLFGSEDKEEKETTETTETTETHTIGGNIKVEEINTNLIRSIVDLKKQIFEFKKTLFFELVTNDIYHSPSNINAMMAFHALWLQMIAFWIGTLDTRSIPEPNFPSKKLTENFKLLSEIIISISNESLDGHTLVYSLLTKISTEHYPFDLGDTK